MRLARLRSIPEKGVSLDTETHKITRDEPVPRLVLGSAGWLEPGPRIGGALLDKQATRELFAQCLEDDGAILIGANIARFDLLVLIADFARLGIDILPLVFALFRAGRLFDIQISEALNAIAEGTLGIDPRTDAPLKNPETGKPGSYSLSMVVSLVLGREDAKANDEGKLKYGEYDDVPLKQLPQSMQDYPVDDGRNTHESALAQIGALPKVATDHDWGQVPGPDGKLVSMCVACGSTRVSAQCMVRRPHKNLHQVATQSFSAFCLALGDSHGFRVDQRKVDLIEAYSIRKRDAAIGPFLTAGIVREDGSENQAVLKKFIAEAYGAKDKCPKCSGTGQIPHHDQPTLVCKACRGRCQPWKGGGKINAPTVENCAACENKGRVNHHNVKLKKCEGPVDPKTDRAEKTCCGTGYDLRGVEVPRTDTNDIGMSGDALFESADDVLLMPYGEFNEDDKILSSYIPFLRRARLCVHCGRSGVVTKNNPDPHTESCPTRIGVPHAWRDVALTLSSNAVLETGRVSYRGLIQTFPRWKGFIVCEPGSPFDGRYIPSLRECFVARDAVYDFVEVPDDYVLQAGEEIVK